MWRVRLLCLYSLFKGRQCWRRGLSGLRLVWCFLTESKGGGKDGASEGKIYVRVIFVFVLCLYLRRNKLEERA